MATMTKIVSFLHEFNFNFSGSNWCWGTKNHLLHDFHILYTCFFPKSNEINSENNEITLNFFFTHNGFFSSLLFCCRRSVTVVTKFSFALNCVCVFSLLRTNTIYTYIYINICKSAAAAAVLYVSYKNINTHRQQTLQDSYLHTRHLADFHVSNICVLCVCVCMLLLFICICTKYNSLSNRENTVLLTNTLIFVVLFFSFIYSFFLCQF